MFDNPVMQGSFLGAAAGTLMFLLVQEIIRRFALSVTQMASAIGEIRATERLERERQQAQHTATVEVRVEDALNRRHPRRREKKGRWRKNTRR